jgi:hypothetical protein
MDEFHAQVKQQENEAADIQARRIVVFKALGDGQK